MEGLEAVGLVLSVIVMAILLAIWIHFVVGEGRERGREIDRAAANWVRRIFGRGNKD